jgi:hypothetical protein
VTHPSAMFNGTEDRIITAQSAADVWGNLVALWRTPANLLPLVFRLDHPLPP